MASRLAYIVKVDETTRRPHSNADRLDCVSVFGSNVIISKETNLSDLMVFFPTDMQLGEKFCIENDLIRRKDENGNAAGGYLEQNRYLRPLKLRGEVSDGLLLPLTCLSKFTDISSLYEGFSFNELNGEVICQKYVPATKPANLSVKTKGKKTVKKNKDIIEAVFPQHIDTEQLAYNLDKFHEGDFLTITEKLDGTSHRSALLPVKKTNWFRGLFHLKPKIVYKDYCGSRRVTVKSADGGFYGDNNFRLEVHKKLVPHLSPNMEVFGEIVGYVNGSPIMPSCNTKCLNDKNFTKTFGENMDFSYGCSKDEYKFYVYRICLLDEDGDIELEYSTDQIISWCKKHHFDFVPVLDRVLIPDLESDQLKKYLTDLANTFNGNKTPNSTLDYSHVREGCVLRIENHDNFDVYKSKNDAYRIMRGMKVNTSGSEGALDADAAEEMS